MDSRIIIILAVLVAGITGGVISLLFFRNIPRFLPSLRCTSRKQVRFDNTSSQTLTVGATLGESLVMPFVFREVFKSEGIIEEPVTLDIVAGVVFIFMLFAFFVLCKALFRNSSVHIITDEALIIGRNIGLGKTEKYPIKELRRTESLGIYSIEKPTKTLHISVFHENTCVCIARPEFDGKKSKELLLELLRQIPER